MAHDITEALKKSLRHLGCEFKRNQLAYLLLTSKSEQILCGALAHRLYKKFKKDSNVTIVREWSKQEEDKRRFDIAVLRCGKPIALLEAKVAMAFDPLVNLDGPLKSETSPPNEAKVQPSKDVKGDVEKLKEFKDVDGYALALFTVYDGCPHKKHHAAIKYIKGIKRHTCNHQYTYNSFKNKGMPRFRKAVGCRVPSVKCVHEGETPAGKAYGVNVSVCYMLMEISN